MTRVPQGQAGEGPLFLQCLPEPGEVATGVVKDGLLHVDEVKANHGIEFDGPPVGLLADHLAMHLAFRRHIDDEVALDGGLAAQPPARLQGLAPGPVVPFGGRERREMVVPGDDAVLRKVALAAQDLAAPAQAPAAADRGDVDTEFPGRIQNGRTGRKGSAPAGGSEYDFGAGLHG